MKTLMSILFTLVVFGLTAYAAAQITRAPEYLGVQLNKTRAEQTEAAKLAIGEEWAGEQSVTSYELPDGRIGKVQEWLDIDLLPEISSAIRARRGPPTQCWRKQVQTVLGVHLTSVHCVWKQPWGSIWLYSPMDDNVRRFSTWAETDRYTQMEKAADAAAAREDQKRY